MATEFRDFEKEPEQGSKAFFKVTIGEESAFVGMNIDEYNTLKRGIKNGYKILDGEGQEIEILSRVEEPHGETITMIEADINFSKACVNLIEEEDPTILDKIVEARLLFENGSTQLISAKFNTIRFIESVIDEIGYCVFEVEDETRNTRITKVDIKSELPSNTKESVIMSGEDCITFQTTTEPNKYFPTVYTDLFDEHWNCIGKLQMMNVSIFNKIRSGEVLKHIGGNTSIYTVSISDIGLENGKVVYTSQPNEFVLGKDYELIEGLTEIVEVRDDEGEVLIAKAIMAKDQLDKYRDHNTISISIDTESVCEYEDVIFARLENTGEPVKDALFYADRCKALTNFSLDYLMSTDDNRLKIKNSIPNKTDFSEKKENKNSVTTISSFCDALDKRNTSNVPKDLVEISVTTEDGAKETITLLEGNYFMVDYQMSKGIEFTFNSKKIVNLEKLNKMKDTVEPSHTIVEEDIRPLRSEVKKGTRRHLCKTAIKMKNGPTLDVLLLKEDFEIVEKSLNSGKSVPVKVPSQNYEGVVEGIKLIGEIETESLPFFLLRENALVENVSNLKADKGNNLYADFYDKDGNCVIVDGIVSKEDFEKYRNGGVKFLECTNGVYYTVEIAKAKISNNSWNNDTREIEYTNLPVQYVYDEGLKAIVFKSDSDLDKVKESVKNKCLFVLIDSAFGPRMLKLNPKDAKDFYKCLKDKRNLKINGVACRSINIAYYSADYEETMFREDRCSFEVGNGKVRNDIRAELPLVYRVKGSEPKQPLTLVFEDGKRSRAIMIARDVEELRRRRMIFEGRYIVDIENVGDFCDEGITHLICGDRILTRQTLLDLLDCN